MRSEGIDLRGPEKKELDPYTMSRRQPHYAYTTPSDYDKLRQFLDLDRKVLRFYCIWDDRDNMFGELRPHVSYKTFFFLQQVRKNLCCFKIQYPTILV